jgi:hypothetical protein
MTNDDARDPAGSLGSRNEPAIHEKIAAIVYDAMRFDREATAPKWQNGNSFAEDRARTAADQIAVLLEAAE